MELCKLRINSTAYSQFDVVGRDFFLLLSTKQILSKSMKHGVLCMSVVTLII